MDTITSILPNEAMDGFDEGFSDGLAPFFFKINCFLKDYNYDGGKNAVGTINHYCKAYNINQRIICMTVQKEQGALEMQVAPAQYIMDKICGCGVLESGLPLPKFIGFENQIAGACSTYRRWFGAFFNGVVAGITDGHDNIVNNVIAGSAITLSLLKYTPSISAMHLAEKVYHDHF